MPTNDAERRSVNPSPDHGIGIDTMRRVDRWAGIPLCAAATILIRLWRLIRPGQTTPIRRVLFIELSEMGSAILANPAMSKLRNKAEAELFFVIFAHNAGSLNLTAIVAPERIFTIRTASFWSLAVDTAAFLLWTRRSGIDTVLDLELFSRFSGLLSGLSGASRRIGFHNFHGEGLYRGNMLTHRVIYNPHIHIAKNFIALVDALFADTPMVPYAKSLIGDEQLTLDIVPPGEIARSDLLTRIKALAPRFDPKSHRLVLINPNTGDIVPQRRWMPERFADLIGKVLEANSDVFVLITGAPSERAAAENIRCRCRGERCIAFAGHSALTDLPALYALATVMVTNDSGPAHLASACRLPTIVLFGPETPRLYQPLGSSIPIYAGLACSPCVTAQNHRRSPCDDNLCMRAISVDQVFQVVERILSETLLLEPCDALTP